MKIGIDIDDVIVNTAEILTACAQIYDTEILGRNGTLTKEKVYSLSNGGNVGKAMNWTDKQTFDFKKRYHEYVLTNSRTKPFASEVINRLHDEGHEIHVVTARNVLGDLISDAVKVSEKLLAKHGIKYHFCIAECSDKAKYCLENGIEIFIDDSLATCLDIYTNGIKVCLMNTPHNVSLDSGKIQRVFSLPEFYYMVVPDAKPNKLIPLD